MGSPSGGKGRGRRGSVNARGGGGAVFGHGEKRIDLGRRERMGGGKLNIAAKTEEKNIKWT